MNTLKRKYNQLVKKYQKIENKMTENEIHDKRVILRRIFPILATYKMNPSKIKNGEKAFKLFGKLRDIQVQMMKVESLEQTNEIIKYHVYLKKIETELKGKVSKFSKKKELVFPVIKKKSKLETSKVISKTEKSLNKLIERINSRSIDDAEDVHKIRIEFKKFRYRVEILSYLENIDESKLDMLKMYQDKLGDIQDYEVLINGIKKYCKKRKLEEDELIDVFEHDQDTLIENFDNQIELFIAVCRDVLNLSKSVERGDDTKDLNEKSGLIEDLKVEKRDEINSITESSKNSTNGVSTDIFKLVDSITDYVKKNDDALNVTSVQVEVNKVESITEDVNGDEKNKAVNLKKKKTVLKNEKSTDDDILTSTKIKNN